MNQLIVVAFDHFDDARNAMKTLRALERDGRIRFEDTALVERDPDGTAHVRNEVSGTTETAAVIGAVFWAGAVGAMDDRDPHEVERALHELSRKELVRPARQSSMEGEAEYGFWHLLVRDVAYQQIPRAARAAKHLAAANWLETRAGEQVEELAYHTGEALTLAQATGDAGLEAEVTPRAAHYALLAGERMLGLDAARALDLLDRTKALTPEEAPGFPLVLLRWAVAARERERGADRAGGRLRSPLVGGHPVPAQQEASRDGTYPVCG